MTPRVQVVTRVGCHLCAEALTVVRRVLDETGDGYEEVDVDADAELRRRYGEQVPVVLVDGQVHDTWWVDEARLRAALRRRPGRWRPW